MNGKLPIRVLDVSDTDTIGAADRVNVVTKISRQPGLAEKIFVVCTPIINTETRLGASLQGTMVTGGQSAPPLYNRLDEILNTNVDHGFSAQVSSKKPTANRCVIIGEGGRSSSVVVLIQLLS